MHAAMVTLVVLFICSGVYAGQVTLTTYYPAPTGNYDKLSANELRLGNSKSECSADNEGAMRYNSSSKAMEYCNGKDWSSLGGRSSCPAGFTMIGTAGTAEAFCISTTSEAGADFITAVANCQAKQMRLCSAEEWMTMCVAEPRGSFNDRSDWAFAPVYTGNAAAALIMGATTGGSCVWSATDTANKVPYRCCLR